MFSQRTVSSYMTSTVQRTCCRDLSDPLFWPELTLTIDHLLIFFHGKDRRSVNITYRTQEQECWAHGVWRRKMSAVCMKTKLNVLHSSETVVNWQSVYQNFRSLFFKTNCLHAGLDLYTQVNRHIKRTIHSLFRIELALGLLDLLAFSRKAQNLDKVLACLTVKEWIVQEEPGWVSLIIFLI